MGTERDDRLMATVRQAVRDVRTEGKIGKRVLQPLVGSALQSAGFDVDYEDSRAFLGAGLAVWRSKDSDAVDRTAGRRLIDLVVYEEGRPVALVETESDLNDLREMGVSKRNGHYDVFSIARGADGCWFHSYKSLERMAAAAFYSGRSDDPDSLVRELGAIRSDDPMVHNPSSLQLILVSGRCRPLDQRILDKRLRSLGAALVCVRMG